MKNLKVTIQNIKNISNASIEFPIETGIYAIVGSNGCGKSTILQGMAQTISRHHLGQLKDEDVSSDTFVEFEFDRFKDRWSVGVDGYWVADTFPHVLRFNGLYEGSLFYGTRFADSRSVDDAWTTKKIDMNDIVESDEYIIQQLSYILHGDYKHYQALFRLRNRIIAQGIGLANTPYFYKTPNGKLISQYRMSSGECLLISLLHFIYNSLIRRSLPKNRPILMLIDEIELALHPIAVHRLLVLLKSLLADNENLIIYLTTHAPEVIRSISPEAIYHLNNNEGKIEVVNPCYPSYSIRDIYKHDGFDFLFLVEDDLAKIVVEKLLITKNLKNSKLVHIVPVGGWQNVLSLQSNLLINNVLGAGKQVISILDGDIEVEAQKEFPNSRKIFLPFMSIEKFLYSIAIQDKNKELKKSISDKYFSVKSLDQLIAEFTERYPGHTQRDNKKLYFSLIKDLESRNISEHQFITYFSDDIMSKYNFDGFITSLSRCLE